MAALIFSLLLFSLGAHAHRPTELLCTGQCTASALDPPPTQLAAPAYRPLQLGRLAPAGWLKEQLVRQANSLSGWMAKSTFPGADTVNSSLWVGGDGHVTHGTTQWLPYWMNGNVPLVALLEAAQAGGRLDPDLGLSDVVDRWVRYVLDHRNLTNGWIGPYTNEPGDANGHGLWDPLNMLRSLLNYAQAHPAIEREVAVAVVAHLAAEAGLLSSDPIIKWAQTRWPTFVELCQYVVDWLVPKYGADPAVMPLGGAQTVKMLLAASRQFQARGMDWYGYYHRTGPIKFPTGAVAYWNTNDHGVNNAEGALRWPSVAFRMSSNASDAAQMQFALSTLDKYQAQFQSLFCADEVFCGRDPNRGTETCAVVEAIASLAFGFITLGELSLLDRMERLAFNALPAALTADMWTHVYVQQANSVFAGRTGPKCDGCGKLGRPSGEDQTANYYGVSHFRECALPARAELYGQRAALRISLKVDRAVGGAEPLAGWPKFAMHSIVTDPTDGAIVVASMVPANATTANATILVDSSYPFGDSASITVTARLATSVKLRIPGWADQATVNGRPVANGTLAVASCPPGETKLLVELRPAVRVEYGWGNESTNAAGVSRGPLVFALHPHETRVVIQNYSNLLPARPRAVDYQISTNDTWNFGLVLPGDGQTGSRLKFDPTPSAGWSIEFPFDDSGEFPFSITVPARQVPAKLRLNDWGRQVEEWTYWSGSNDTDVPPASPVDCSKARCSPNEQTLRLVPFGSTNIRIGVFPWIKEALNVA